MSSGSRKRRLQRQLSGRLIRELFVKLLVSIVVMGLLFGAAYWVCSRMIWYETMPLYPLVHGVHIYMGQVFLVLLLLVVLVMCWWNFRRFAILLDRVVEAVGDVYEGRDEAVRLPDELGEVENQLNQMMLKARVDRERVREAEQRKNDLIVYMAHDLKTPLTSVIGYLTLLHDEKELSGELKDKYLDVALRKSERLEELINEFFEITRFNLSHMELEISSVNMTVMLEQLMYEFRPMFAEKGLSYQLELEPMLEVSCDVDKMERVFDNLLKNAVNYSYANTQLTMRALRRGKKGMELTLINHGRTIPPEKLERIFEQFFRMESARTSKTGGAGLGLAIAREIVQLHGGTLTCASENETIVFTLRLEG